MATTVPRTTSPTYFDGSPRKLFIDGQWVDAAAGQTFETLDPATGEVLAEVARGEAEDIDRAVRAARKAFDGPWSKLNPSERGRIIYRIGDLIAEHAEELAELESLDNGKPVGVAKAADVRAGGRDVLVHGGLGHARSKAARSTRPSRTCRAPSSTPTRCASRSASSARSSRGTSRC